MNPESRRSFTRQYWPVVIILLFVVLIYSGIRQKAKIAVAPPYADALQYYCKASFVWEDIRAGKPAHILASPPAMRPPGIAFLLYPVGFKASVRSFLVRSQFVPFLLWMASLLVLLWPLCQTARQRLAASAVVCCLGSLPMFFQFELNPASFPGYSAVQCWGMADTLLAAVGALSASLMIASARTRSLSLVIAGWIAGALCIFIKPAGVLIMASAGLILVVEIIAQACESARADGQMSDGKLSTRIFAISALSIGAVLFAATLWLCVNSEYLGKETQQLFSAALGVSRQMYPVDIARQLLGFIRSTVGWPITIVFIVAASVGLARLFLGPRQAHRRALFVRLTGIVILLLAGLCWWEFMSGSIPRYFFPFVALLIIWILPDVFRQFLFNWPQRYVTPGLACLFLPPAILASLFALAHPPVWPQRLLGVNLSAGLWSEELKAGEMLVREAETTGRQFKLYTLDGITTEFPHFQDYIKWVHSKPRGMLLWPVRANEWAGDPGLKLERILDCEYILFEGDMPTRNPAARKVVSTYKDEILEFATFVNSLSEEQGVTRRRFGMLTVIHLMNRSLFEKAFWEWVPEIDWRTTFASRNPMRNIAAPVKTSTAAPRFWGSIDSADCEAITGWAWDSTQPHSPVKVEIYDGATLLGTVTSDIFRADLEKIAASGRLSFAYPVPASLRDGKSHAISGKIAGTEFRFPPAPKIVLCPAGASEK